MNSTHSYPAASRYVLLALGAFAAGAATSKLILSRKKPAIADTRRGVIGNAGVNKIQQTGSKWKNRVQKFKNRGPKTNKVSALSYRVLISSLQRKGS